MYREDDDLRKTLYQLTTDALVVHCPGPLRRPDHPIRHEWDLAEKTLFADQGAVGACSDHPDLTVITYNTGHDQTLLEACCDHVGLRDLVVLGRGQPWSFELKILPVRDYLLSNPVAENVLCLDAFDVLLFGCPDIILDRYSRSDAKVLFSSTAGNWPFSSEIGAFEEQVGASASPAHRHLNSGAYIGKTSYVLECLEEIADAIGSSAAWCRTSDGFDDQLAWRELHRRRYPDIQIDTTCSVFVRFDEHR